MKILAILQNQWFKNPEKIKAMYERRPDLRNQYIKSFLFMGCVTGKRLQSAFGKELCNAIIWEECSKEIGGTSDSVFEPDIAHIKNAIATHQPDIILCFGKVAEGAIREINPSQKVLFAPHPAARQNPMPALKEVANQLA